MEEKKFNVKLNGMEISGLYLLHPEEPLQIREYTFSITSEFKVNAEKKLLISIPSIKISDQQNPDIIIASLSLSIGYEVENFEEAVKPRADGLFDINDDLDRKLTTISLNTFRGVIYTTFKTTYLQNVTLPLIDEKQLKRYKKSS